MTAKADVQDSLDELVAEYREKSDVLSWFGVPLTEMSAEELIAIASLLYADLQRERSRHMTSLDILCGGTRR